MSGINIAGILTVFAYGMVSASGTISIHMTGEKAITNVRAITEDSSTFISIEDISERLGIVTKELDQGLIGLCKEELCIPIQLENKADVRRDTGTLMINAGLIAELLSSKAEWLVLGRTLHFTRTDQVMLDTVLKVGDAVPNFALTSITSGKTVPFSSFRGKRVLLFLWASW